MTKIDSEELIKRIERLDPYYYDSGSLKWKIIQIIKKMVKEQTDGNVN